jgi:prepilin-type processing-associated H-X9-DG protein
MEPAPPADRDRIPSRRPALAAVPVRLPLDTAMSHPVHRPAFTLVEAVLAIAIVGTLVALVLPAVQAARAASLRAACANNLRQIGLALGQYHQVRGCWPPGATHPALGFGSAGDAYPLLNWEARLLPYVDQQSLWEQTQRAYAEDPTDIRDPPHVGLDTQVALFVCPADSIQKSYGFTSYVGVAGTDLQHEDGILFLDSQVRIGDVTDGMSNTVMVGERPPAKDSAFGHWYGGWGPWAVGSGFLGVNETDIHDGVQPCPVGPYEFGPGNYNNPCDVFHFWSMHRGGANFLFADGAVHFLPYSASAVLPALATRAGGEDVPSFEN